MKKYVFIAAMALLAALVFTTFYHPDKTTASVKTDDKAIPAPGTYIVIAWNDLGMHCANKYFGTLCILPPYNNQHAQVIRVGSLSTLPLVSTFGLKMTYEIPGNTYSVGKTDFWTYAPALFGANLPDNIGLTGVSLSGVMQMTGNYFFVEGIPITPYPDADLVNEHPYQLTLIKVFNASDSLLASTMSVIPVSAEINCVSSGCHISEQDILNKHELVAGFNPNIKPILCAKCHQDNALSTPGTAGTPVFSEAIHVKHGELTDDCFKCHPGPNTQCFRDIMKSSGMICQDCHGSVDHVGQTVANGRAAWLQEPDCGAVACHGPQHAPEPGKLFKNSKGHGNLFCSTCHGSPHAIFPTTQPNDNLQSVTLQGSEGTISNCVVCHGYVPSGAGPHGVTSTVLTYEPSASPEDGLLEIWPNPVKEKATIPFTIATGGPVTLSIYDNQGNLIKVILNRQLQAGTYNAELNAKELRNGTYYYVLRTVKHSFTKKMILMN